MKKSKNHYLPIKRILDIIIAIFAGLIYLSLIWWWVFIINCFVTKGHPLFLQERVGINHNIFKIVKFRSMKLDANPYEAPSDLTISQQRSMETKFGKFLRATSIDETPQVLNVLIGHMSIIGPRPGAAHNEDYLIKYRDETVPSAFEVRPGIGGLAQLKMKRDHDSKTKAMWDSEYVKNLSFWLDLKIFVLTLLKIFTSTRGC